MLSTALYTIPNHRVWYHRIPLSYWGHRVFDTRLGGFSIPLVGTGRIELGKKLPWCSDYEPPLAEVFAKEALLRAVMADDDDDQ